MVTGDDDFDDVDWDEWMKKSEAEIDREFKSAMRQHEEWWCSLSPAEQFLVKRKTRVELCLRWRKFIRENPHLDFARENLRQCQKMLLELRIERATNGKVGHA